MCVYGLFCVVCMVYSAWRLQWHRQFIVACGLAVLDRCLQTEHYLSLIVQLTEIVSELISLYGHFDRNCCHHRFCSMLNSQTHKWAITPPPPTFGVGVSK